MTADVDSNIAQLCQDAGMDGIIGKPVEEQQLLHVLAQIHTRTQQKDMQPQNPGI